LVGTGFKFNGSGYDELEIDEEYTDNDPLMIIMPADRNGLDNPTGGGGQGGGTGSNLIHQVKIGWFKCGNTCGGIFEGDLEMTIKRVAARYNQSTGLVESHVPVIITFKYERKYAKSAKYNWSNSNNGWKYVDVVWDTNWFVEKDRQGIVIYDYDWDASIKKVTVGATFKGFGLNVSIEREVPYEGDFLGKNDEWWRNWYYTTHNNPGPGEAIYNGLIVRSTGDPIFTMPIWTYYQ